MILLQEMHQPQFVEYHRFYDITSIEYFTSEADLTNIKFRGWLKHPNKYSYKLLSVVEDTVKALITKCETFTFPRAEH